MGSHATFLQRGLRNELCLKKPETRSAPTTTSAWGWTPKSNCLAELLSRTP